MFKGFTTIDLLKEEPRVLIAVLADQLVIANKAIATQAEEIKQLRAETKEMQKYMSEDYHSPAPATIKE